MFKPFSASRSALQLRNGFLCALLLLPFLAVFAPHASAQSIQSLPRVEVAAGPAVTEGEPATFHVRVRPVQTEDLEVPVTVWNFGKSVLAKTRIDMTVTIPANTSQVTASVPTIDDDVDENNTYIDVTPSRTSKFRLGAGKYYDDPFSAYTRVLVKDNDPGNRPILGIHSQEPKIPNFSNHTWVSEGDTVDFTIKADEAATVSFEVCVGVTDSHGGKGDFLAPQNEGRQCINFPAGQSSVTFSVPTVDDDVAEETDDLVIYLLGGSGYFTKERLRYVRVFDNDGAAVPVVNIPEFAGATEGGSATFTLTALPRPTSDLTVRVRVTSRGDYGVATGYRNVTIPPSGTATLSVDTADDSVDEPKGRVAVFLQAGDGYTVGSLAAGSVDILDNDEPSVPQVNITASAGGTEGEAATFTLTATPAPASELVVGVTVAATGDYGVVTGARNVTIPTGGSASLTVATTDDSADEPNGTVTVTLNAGSGYTVGALSTGTADILDDDEPTEPQTQTLTDDDIPPPTTCAATSTDLVEKVRGYYELNRSRADRGHGENWLRVLIAFGAETHATLQPYTSAEAQAGELAWDGWVEVREELERLEGCGGSQQKLAPPPTPVITISAGAAVTEGGDAVFTLTAAPAPASAIDVSVTVTETGSFAASGATGARTVTVGTGGTATFTVATENDTTDEPDGSIKAAVGSGSGYTLGGSATASVAVSDNDDPPEVNITASAGGTEGGSATFTLTATPPPASDLIVGVTVASTGDYGVVTGDRNVTIPTGGSASLAVATTDDTADEPNGTVTVTLNAGSGYTVGALSTGTADILDDDAPVQPQTCAATSADLVEKVRGYYELNRGRADRSHGENWLRVLIAFGAETHATLQPYTSAEAQAGESAWDGWVEVREELERLEGCGSQQQSVTPPTPEITISGGAGVAEGGGAEFTLTAAPAPTSEIDVTVTVTETGSFAVSGATGARAVTVGTGGTATFTVATENDTTDEPDGSIEAAVGSGSGYTVGGSATASVAVSDNDDAPVPEVSIAGSAGVTEGGTATFTLTAAPTPASAIQVSVTVTETGSFAASGATGTRAVTIGTDGTAAFTVATDNDEADEPNGAIEATLAAGAGYTVGSAATASVAVSDNDDVVANPHAALIATVRGYAAEAGEGGEHVERWQRVLKALGEADAAFAGLSPMTAAEAQGYADKGWTRWVPVAAALTAGEGGAPPQPTPPQRQEPEVSISGGAAVTEGVGAVFTLTASPPPTADIEVKVTVTETGDFAASGATGARTVTVGTGGTAAFTVATEDDAADEADGSVAAEVAAGAGYAVGSPSSAEVAVSDDDAPASAPSLSVSDASGPEGRPMKFTVRLSPPSDRRVSARVETRESSPGSAREGVDYGRNGWSLTFEPGETEKHRWVYVFDDAHDDGGETFEFVVTRARGAEVADAVGVGTIENADPLPGAWLARLGRTVAEQAIEGVAGRVSALRGAGFDSSFRAARAPFPESAAAASPALSRTVPGMAPRAAEFPGRGRPDRADQGCLSAPIAGGRGDAADRLRSLAVRSHFTATGGRDALGGAWSLWGRASENHFGGAARGEGTDVSLDGRVATGLLGADYGRDGWLLGVALARSSADGGYAALGEGVRHEAGSEAAGQEDGGEGRVASSLTAVVPYASMKATESLRVWGAAGLGAGEVALRTRGGRLGADTEWTMAAAGLRSERLSPAGGGGLSLAVVSDALWTRLSSDGADGLRGTESDTTRLRLGLEGAWRIGLAGGGHVTPRLELGARRDGGDAERGFGVEAGGGVAWQAPALGLAVEVSARALVSHEDSDLDDRGFSVSLAYDPDAATGRGLSLRLTQEAGGRARGGLDALFAPAPLAARGSGYGAPAAGRDWRMEAAYGFALLGGRYTGSPHAGFGRSRHSRDWTVGWRLAPEGAAAADMAVGISAFRRAYTGAPPEHGLGLEFTGRW